MKELHYFDRLNKTALPERSLPYARKETDRLEIARARARDDRDRRFLDEIDKVFAQPSLDLENYARLFADHLGYYSRRQLACRVAVTRGKLRIRARAHDHPAAGIQDYC